jgi:hypothetical protein
MSKRETCNYCEGRGEKSQLLYEPNPNGPGFLDYGNYILPCEKCNKNNYHIKREEALIVARAKWVQYCKDGKCQYQK